MSRVCPTFVKPLTAVCLTVTILRAMVRTPREKPAASGVGSSIRVVASRTGISADTLRVWERRYGFPKPERRAGGSRIYREEDVERLRLVSRALTAGFRPGEVVPLGWADLRKVIELAEREGLAAPDPPPPPPPLRAPSAEASVETILEALKSDDLPGVRSRLRAAAVALGPKSFVMHVAHPLAVRVGELWAEGELEVRHEHLASTCLSTQLRLLLGTLDDVQRGPSVVLSTFPDEPHALGIDMIAVYLAASLAAPHLLGPDTPPEQIASAARAVRADVVGLSVSPVAETRAVQKHLKTLMTELPKSAEVWIGGEGATKLALPARARLVMSWADLDAALAGRRGHAA